MDITWLGGIAIAVLIITCINGYRRGFVRQVVSIFFVFFSLALVWFVNPYVNEFLKENTPVYTMIEEGCQNLVKEKTSQIGAIDGIEQKNLIEELPVPEVIKNMIEKDNTVETYKLLAVRNFGEYVSNYLAVTLMNGLSFIISYLLVTIVIRTIAYALDLIAKLPIINGVNRLAGALLGGAEGVIFIWIVLLMFTLVCGTDIGKIGMGLIQRDKFLSFLYDKDVFIRIFMNVFYGKNIV